MGNYSQGRQIRFTSCKKSLTIIRYLQDQSLIQISEEEFEGIYYSILEGIIVMHDNHYAHRDIKPQNILYVERKGWVISDFGCSIKYGKIQIKYNSFLFYPYKKIEDDYEITGTILKIISIIQIYLTSIKHFYLLKLDNKSLILLEKQQQNQIYFLLIYMLFNLPCYYYQDLKLNSMSFKELLMIAYLLILQLMFYIQLRKKLKKQIIIGNKNLEQVKLIQKQSYKRVNIQNTVSPVVKAMQSVTMDDENQKIKFKLRSLEFQYLRQKPENVIMYEKEINNIYNQCSDENKLYMELLLAQFDFTKPRCEINKKLFHSADIFKVNENMKSWQYGFLQEYLYAFGDITQCYENCIKYQEVKKKKNIKYKLEEMEYAFILGFYEVVKTCIDTIEQSAYYFDDENYLRYYYHKARINNQWWDLQDEIVSYSQHVKYSEEDFSEINNLTIGVGWNLRIKNLYGGCNRTYGITRTQCKRQKANVFHQFKRKYWNR